MIERTNIKHRGKFCGLFMLHHKNVELSLLNIGKQSVKNHSYPKSKGVACFIFIAMVFFFFSCAPQKYLADKPHVYKSSVELIKSKLPLEERSALQLELNNYLDDSIKVQTKSIVGFKHIVHPPVFDSANVERSKVYIKSYFSSLGYYRPIFDTFTVSPIKNNKYRLSVKIVVETGIKTKIDTISYAFKVPELEKLALGSKKNALIKKGDGFSRQSTIKEMDRLVSLYNNNGYFKLSRGAIVAEEDTTDKSLVSLENDPLIQLQQASQRLLNPTVGLKFMQRPNFDSSYFLKYTLGNINIYPESFIDGETAGLKLDTTFKKFGRNGVNIYVKNRLFRGKAIRRLNALVPGKFYDAQDYFNTINTFTQVGAWQQADVKDSIYTDSIPKVDLDIFLYPAKKYSYKVDLEGSSDVNKNTANLLAGSYVGLSLVTSFLNKNFAKTAVQWNSNARGGFELSGSNIFQYLVGSVGTTFTIPRLWPPIKNMIGNVSTGRTYISSNFTYTDRKDFFTLKNLNAALIFEWRKTKESKYTFTWKLPNVELVKLSGGDSLANLIAANPYLGYAFNKGLVISTAMTVERSFTYNKPNKTSYARLTAEESGLTGGKSIFGTEIFHFWKLDGEFRHLITFPRHKWAFRFIGGFGRDYSHGDSTMPFFRQFIGGGPNGLRAWRLRQVGLGSSLQSDTSSSSFKDRLGDIYLEWNAEYRFNMFKLFGFPVEGALFTDIGNIWNRKPTYNKDALGNVISSNGGDLNIKSFYKDLAVASGVGFRIDLTYLRLRADIGYKVKDPVRDNNGWMRSFEWKSWDRVGVAKNNNVSIQIGIDYPF